MRVHNLLAIALSLVVLSPISYAAESGKTVFTNRCQGCHGADGKGNQTMAKALQANIPDITSKDIAKKPDAEILELFSKGKGKMPPVTGLGQNELKDLLSYVKSLAKGK